MEAKAGSYKLLAVDDDPLVLEAISLSTPDHWSVTTFHDINDVSNLTEFDAAVIDVHLCQRQLGQGLRLVTRLKQCNPRVSIMMLSGDLNLNTMEESLHLGAERYLAKPLNPHELQLNLSKIETLLRLNESSNSSELTKISWIGGSKVSIELKKKVSLMNGERGPILLEGETGTGKEIVARLLHHQSNRSPFVPVNVAALPDTLFESELFGHVKGAFTGADQNKMGLIEMAAGGTLFIDEIEALPMPQQAKLLRFLESGEVRRVGDKEVKHILPLVIVATNQNLELMSAKNEFRQDLYWRLSCQRIELPSLRERKEDIQELCNHFLRRDPTRFKILTPQALEVLTNHDWPGNVRELKQLCEKLILQSPLPLIRSFDVLTHLRQAPLKSESLPPIKIDIQSGLNANVQKFEAQIILKALNAYNDVDDAAKTLQISRSSLYKKIKDYQIDWRG